VPLISLPVPGFRSRAPGFPGSRVRGSRPGTDFLLIGLLLLAFPLVVGAQEAGPVDLEALPRPMLQIRAVTGPIVIDGRMDDPAWQDVEVITDFVQAEPHLGAPPSERTEVRITYDHDYLYIGARMWESDIEGIVRGGMERNVPGTLMEEMDSFGVTLDTFLDRRNSFIFFVNPAGGLKDGQGSDDGRSRDYGWNGVVDARTTIDDRGWTVEMAIPWRTLRYDPSDPSPLWGLNLSRRIRRHNEVSYWAPLDPRNRIFLMSRAGTMAGMANLPAARNLSVKPFTVAAQAGGSAVPREVRGSDLDGGIDLKYGITPSMTLDLTWRTDFSQVEVDQQQVNLSRFPVFFPELREFFLENSGTFAFGDLGGGPGGPRLGSSLRDFTLFHSRQIGLRGGSPVPLLGGGRITGRAGGVEMGVLNVRSEAFDGRLAENFSVVRLRRDVGANSNVGVMFTNRESTGNPDRAEVAPPPANRAAGVDANLRLLGNLWINSYLALTDAGGTRDQAARLSLGWRDPFWNTSVSFRQLGEDFSPGIGFVRRRAIREGYGTVGVHHRPDAPWLQEINPYVEANRITDLSGRIESTSARGALGLNFPDRSSVNLSGNRQFERLVVPFEIRPGTFIPVGDYTFHEGSVTYRSSQGRALSGNAGVSGGEFYGGTRLTLTGGVRWQPDYRLILELGATHNSLDVQDTRFTADLYSARAQYAVSTRLNFTGFVQYNADVDEVITNLRANLVHAPLSDIFLLYTERRPAAASGVLERFITLKVTRLLIF
jgi:hypothetical protein